MAWPPAAPDTVSTVASVLEAIHARLSRAESQVHDLLIIGNADQEAGRAADSAGQLPQKANATPQAVVGAWNANLILAAYVPSRDTSRFLELKVLDHTATTVLRKGRLEIALMDAEAVGPKASEMAAHLLELPQQQLQISDEAEIASAPPQARNLLHEANKFRDEPNGSKIDEAKAKYVQLTTMYPRFALPFAELGRLFLVSYKKSHKESELDLADSNLTMADKLNPGSESVKLGKVKLSLARGNPDQALELLARILQIDPINQAALHLSADAFSELHRRDDEARSLRDLTHTRPNYWPAYNDLGACLQEQAKYREAAKCFEIASAIAPSVVMPLINLGVVYTEMDRHEEAVEALEKSIGTFFRMRWHTTH